MLLQTELTQIRQLLQEPLDQGLLCLWKYDLFNYASEINAYQKQISDINH